MKSGCLVATILLSLAVSPAGAVTETNFLARTTADLVELCAPATDDPLGGYATSFCQGFAQGAVAVEMQHGALSAVPMFCLPDPRPKRTETMSRFVSWARAAPDRLNLAPEEGILTFLSERYPCPAIH